MTAEKSPGQLNYEAHQEALRTRINCIVDRPWDGWEQAVKNDTENRWESGAAAVRKPLVELVRELSNRLSEIPADAFVSYGEIHSLIARADAELNKGTP